MEQSFDSRSTYSQKVFGVGIPQRKAFGKVRNQQTLETQGSEETNVSTPLDVQQSKVIRENYELKIRVQLLEMENKELKDIISKHNIDTPRVMATKSLPSNDQARIRKNSNLKATHSPGLIQGSFKMLKKRSTFLSDELRRDNHFSSFQEQMGLKDIPISLEEDGLIPKAKATIYNY